MTVLNTSLQVKLANCFMNLALSFYLHKHSFITDLGSTRTWCHGEPAGPASHIPLPSTQILCGHGHSSPHITFHTYLHSHKHLPLGHSLRLEASLRMAFEKTHLAKRPLQALGSPPSHEGREIQDPEYWERAQKKQHSPQPCPVRRGQETLLPRPVDGTN